MNNERNENVDWLEGLAFAILLNTGVILVLALA
jgi:hypothetical protein